MEYKLSEKFKLDSNLVFAQDDTLKFLKNVPDNFFKLIITSPPYNIGKDYETRVSIESYLKTQEKIIKELIRTLDFNGSLCWQTGNYVELSEVYPLDIYFYPIFKKFNLFLRNRIIWHFEHGLHASKRFSGRYETLLWFTKSNEYVFNLDPVRVPAKYPGKRAYKGSNIGKPSCNPKGKNPSDVWERLVRDWNEAFWEIPNVKANHPEKTDHPCQFPIELVERCVLALTNEDDTVFDPFAGVGSSLIAAIKHNRKAFGVDKEKTYVEKGIDRIQAFLKGELKIRPLGKPVHKPSGKVAEIPQEWIEKGNICV